MLFTYLLDRKSQRHFLSPPIRIQMCGDAMKNLVKHSPIVNALPYMTKCQLKTFLKTVSPEFVRCVCEICHNLLKANIPISTNQHSKLKKHKKIIRALAARGKSLKQKKILINQRGGFAFLPLLAPLLASAVGGLVGKAIGKRI